MVARVSLLGELADAGALHDRASGLRDDVRAIAASISPDLHVEKVKVLVSAPAGDDRAVLGEDLDSLIDEGVSDPDLMKAIEADLERFMVAANTALGDLEDSELRL